MLAMIVSFESKGEGKGKFIVCIHQSFSVDVTLKLYFNLDFTLSTLKWIHECQYEQGK